MCDLAGCGAQATYGRRTVHPLADASRSILTACPFCRPCAERLFGAAALHAQSASPLEFPSEAVAAERSNALSRNAAALLRRRDAVPRRLRSMLPRLRAPPARGHPRPRRPPVSASRYARLTARVLG